jgi:hypothetical protein
MVDLFEARCVKASQGASQAGAENDPDKFVGWSPLES